MTMKLQSMTQDDVNLNSARRTIIISVRHTRQNQFLLESVYVFVIAQLTLYKARKKSGVN